MRLLHAGADPLRRRAPQGRQAEGRRRSARADVRESLPLRRVPEHRRRHQERRRESIMRLFTFQSAKAVDDAIAGGQSATFLAGGTNLVDLMKIEVLNPD